MKLYLMRHGPAHNVGEGGAVSDFERALSPGGMAVVEAVARQLVSLEVRPAVIMCSPLVRARQTAELVAETLGVRTRLEVDDTFACGLDFQRGLASVNRCMAGDVFVVGHAPDMGGFASWLLSAGGEISIAMRPAAICCLEFERRVARAAGTLAWLLPPPIR